MKRMLTICFMILFVLCFCSNVITRVPEFISITILYDNYIHTEGSTSDWGFSCLIEGTDQTILFDTGRKGDVLTENMAFLDQSPEKIDVILISHNHGDHTGGLNAILDQKSDLSVYFGKSWPESFGKNVEDKGSTPVRVGDPVKICDHVYSTGELSGSVNEQSLILNAKEGFIVITGCSHPGIVDIVQKAKELHDKNIHLVLGGFHLLNHSDAQVQDIIQGFKTLGVEKCGATHCTGDRQIALFEEAFGENYVSMGVGKTITFDK